jgi:gamma-glutamyl-gamma-aminobutyrate hydrolase PuuD
MSEPQSPKPVSDPAAQQAAASPSSSLGAAGQAGLAPSSSTVAPTATPDPLIEAATDSAGPEVAKSVAGPIPEPIVEPVVEPIVEPVAGHVTEPAVEPPVELATEPMRGTATPNVPPAYLKAHDSAWSVFGRIFAARARALFDRAGQRITQRTLRIGVSARIFHPEPGGKGLRGKTLQYLEESVAHWVMSRDVLVFMIPTVGHQGMLHPSNIRLRDYAKQLDGLVLQGGADVSPQSYADVATRPEWPGDRVRDMYELELLHEFIEAGKPVLGVCRGCQLINVAFGGTLYQDIATDVPTATVHVNDQYDRLRHTIQFAQGSTLASMFPTRADALVNSIHHQAVKTLGRDLSIEAVSADDGIVESIRYRKAPFVMGVQWHPEFHSAGGPELLDCTPLLDTFLRHARETRF